MANRVILDRNFQCQAWEKKATHRGLWEMNELMLTLSVEGLARGVERPLCKGP